MPTTKRLRHHEAVIDRYTYRPWLDARLERLALPSRSGGQPYGAVILQAGWKGTETIVPPAGPEYSFEVDLWARRVEVSISPTGRSVRVWVDGNEVEL